MKIDKYWVTETQKILIDGVEQDSTCYGGSNLSEEAARVRAKENYETYQGARVIVLGRNFDARDRETGKLMSEFNCDRLYMTLCQKQSCFRAGLTPKSHRMKMRRYKVQFPREGEDAELQQWLTTKEKARAIVSVNSSNRWVRDII